MEAFPGLHLVLYFFFLWLPPFDHTAAAAKSFQSYPTLCNPINGSLPGSAVPGILQARTLEWVAISFSNAWKWKVKVKSLSHVRVFATPRTAAYQAPPSMGFSRQEYWSGVPLPSLHLTIGGSEELCSHGFYFLKCLHDVLITSKSKMVCAHLENRNHVNT